MMRRGLIIAALAAALGSAPALGASPKLNIQPKIQMNKPVNKPANKPVMRPPSAVVNQVLKLNPGAKVVGIKPQGGNYAVTLKLQGQIKRVIIPGN
jgi:ABC-type glycerol-3-phosphate transport system substrate-binding protein